MAAQNKRLVFNFDGTWNRLDAVCPTNVVLTAESVVPLASDGVAQFNHYDQGVGTGGFLDRILGGTMGAGMSANLADAYRNLVFNYTPGDRIFVFGFSRGAFTARSFVGLLRNIGIVERCHADRAHEAIAIYRARNPDDAAWQARRAAFQETYVRHRAPPIAYLGVWDTVGALGVPNYYGVAKLVNGRFRFHDTSLSRCVESARHAVAIDETRRTFEPTLWDGLDALNRDAGHDPAAPDAPYQQQWFPGVHSAVGGSGASRGLSDEALEWVWAGARLAGLELDTAPESRVYSLQPDCSGRLDAQNQGAEGRGAALKAALEQRMWRRADRTNGPAELYQVSMAARRRWHMPADALPEGKAYRPKVLAGVAAALEQDPQCAVPVHVPDAGTYDLVVVARGDTLGKIAERRLGAKRRWREIYGMNQDKVSDPDLIYCGMTLRVPKTPPAEAPAVEPVPA
jgi:uncharacterized protein (DUF2235 family)